MRTSARDLWLLALLVFWAWSGAARTAEPTESQETATDFIRFVEDEDGAQLQSALVTYERDDGVRVHLVGAVHVGEKSYYDGLSRTFDTYDALLFELIGGDQIPSRQRSSQSGVSLFQRWLKDTLKLEFQLDAIDYASDNFVHADMDAQTFQRLQAERGESLFTIMLRAMKQEMARQKKGEPVPEIGLLELVRVFLSKDSATEMKLLLGRQFENVEATLMGVEGDKGSVILTERNKVAIRVLKETLGDGKKRNIGIFYGAGHLPDLEKRIRKLGFKKTRSEWRVAWDMPGGATEKRDDKPPAVKGRRARF